MSRDDDLEAVGVLVEPQRRRVFEQVQQDGPVSIAELVSVLRLGRTLVGFHVGKLVDAGLLQPVEPLRRPGGKGRPAQRYRVSDREVVVSVPDRRYDLLAGVLLDSVADHRPGESVHDTALRAARRRGAEHGREGVRRPAVRGIPAAWRRLDAVLRRLGYAPRRDGQVMSARNCPFDRFREQHAENVCALNLALSEGYLEGLGIDQVVRARLRPHPDTCCVVFEPSEVRADAAASAPASG